MLMLLIIDNVIKLVTVLYLHRIAHMFVCKNVSLAMLILVLDCALVFVLMVTMAINLYVILILVLVH